MSEKILFPTFDVADAFDKKKLIDAYIRYFLTRTQSMFKWEGLPDTMPQKWLEYYLQVNGNAFITKVNNKLYAFTGGIGGEPNVYYIPTLYTVANPALNLSKSYKIDVEGVLCYNDAANIGLIPMLNKYAALMAENVISLRMASIAARATAVISASDDNTKRSAEEYARKLVDGEIAIVGESAFFDGIKVQPTRQAGATAITDLIELQQYLKASLYNEIGLQANYNMKREAINSNESQMNNDALVPLIDEMLTERQNAVNKINEMFETNISVSLASAWEDNEKEEQAALSNQLDSNEGGEENDGSAEKNVK